MAFFKFRKSSGDVPAPEAPVQSVETIRQRAKYRLVGAMVLILLAVIVLPLLFDKQPRPIAVDTPIEIPDKNKTLPLVIPAVPVEPPATVVTPVAPAPAQSNAVTASPVQAAPAPSRAPAAPKSATKIVEPNPAPTPAGKPAASLVVPKPAEVNRAQALLEGKDVPVNAAESKPGSADAASQRFVVQVGAFADNARAREVRLKLERAGMKTYTQVADTKDGKRVRVRVGPFASRVEAEKTAARVKKLDLPAVLLTL